MSMENVLKLSLLVMKYGMVVSALLTILSIASAQDVVDPDGPGASKGNFSCYKCNSFHAPKCGDWFNNRTWELTPCARDEKMCRKIVQEAWYDNSWNIRYIRQCAKLGEVGYDEGRRCTDRIGTYRIKMRYCYCDNKDGCNAAGRFGMSLVMTMFCFLTSISRIF